MNHTAATQIFQRAAAIVESALSGHSEDTIPLEAFSTPCRLKSYQKVVRYAPLVKCAIGVYMLLAFCEIPSWKAPHGLAYSYADRKRPYDGSTTSLASNSSRIQCGEEKPLTSIIFSDFGWHGSTTVHPLKDGFGRKRLQSSQNRIQADEVDTIDIHKKDELEWLGDAKLKRIPSKQALAMEFLIISEWLPLVNYYGASSSKRMRNFSINLTSSSFPTHTSGNSTIFLFIGNPVIILCIEAVCLCIIVWYVIHRVYSFGQIQASAYAVILLSIVALLDIGTLLLSGYGILALLWRIFAWFCGFPSKRMSLFYLSRLLRPVIFCLCNFSLRRIIASIFWTLYKVREIFAAILLSILLFDWWGIIFFSGTVGHEQFGSFSRGFLSLLMMISTANFREVILPGYAAHPASSIFFVLFYLIVEILLLGLLTAALYSAYRGEHGK
ncbi:hypothetical protein IE077_001768, partial [Cardiosporidium cionae]